MQAEFLRTRVARRVMGLFVLASLLPIALLVVLSSGAVSSQLEEQSEQRLAEIADVASQSLLDRFSFFHSWLLGVGVLATLLESPAGDVQVLPARPAKRVGAAARQQHEEVELLADRVGQGAKLAVPI